MTEEQAKGYFLTPNSEGVSQFYAEVAQNHPMVWQRIRFLQRYKLALLPTIKEGFTALHVAAQFSDLHTLKQLVETKIFDINARDAKQRTPLHVAAIAGRIEHVIFLLSQKVNSLLEDNNGFTALRLPNALQDKCYIKFTASDLQVLVSEFSVNRKSEMGLPYPFKTREFLEAQTLSDRIEEVISKHSLITEDVIENSTIDDIPNLAHFIWIGSVLKNPVYKENILSFKIRNPQMKIILWVSQVDDELLSWCDTHKITAMFVDILLDKKFIHRDFYLLEVQKENFAAAANHLRYEILDRFGGWYFDTDVRCERSLENVLLSKGVIYVYCFESKGIVNFNNCIMAARPNNKYIKAIYPIIKKNYLTREYETTANAAGGFLMRFQMSLAGPGVLFLLVALNIYGIDEIQFVDTTAFSSSSDINWVNAGRDIEKVQNESEIAKLGFKKIINSLVHELMLDPRRLYFDLYNGVFKKYSEYHLARLALHFLCSYWPSIARVEQGIVFENILDEINYKNQLNNHDIIACSKPFLKFYRSNYLKTWEKTYKVFQPLSDQLRNESFYDEKVWTCVENNFFEHENKNFVFNTSLMLAGKLLENENIKKIPKATVLLFEALQSKDLSKLRIAITHAHKALMANSKRAFKNYL